MNRNCIILISVLTFLSWVGEAAWHIATPAAVPAASVCSVADGMPPA